MSRASDLLQKIMESVSSLEKHRDFFVKNGYVEYNHGYNYGWTYKSPSLTVAEVIKYAEAMGYRRSSFINIPVGQRTWPMQIMGSWSYIFEKSGGPYTDDCFSFESADKNIVTKASHVMRVDRS